MGFRKGAPLKPIESESSFEGDMKFTFEYIESQYSQLLAKGYTFITCLEAFDIVKSGRQLPDLTIINRVDVDMNVRRAARLASIFKVHSINASFFLRLHANEYNLMSFENFEALKFIQSCGFEIGYHSEIVDAAKIFGERPDECLRRDLAVMEAMLGEPVLGIASHGGLTGLNNLDFWKNNSPEDFGCRYEAYDPRIFEVGLYVSDSEWVRWKSYRKGQRLVDCGYSPLEHAQNGERSIYLLIHSDTYFDRHIYEV
jgi:hypothetical protein